MLLSSLGMGFANYVTNYLLSLRYERADLCTDKSKQGELTVEK